MVDDAVDELGRAGGVGEDRRPVPECQVGGEDDALLLVAQVDELEGLIRFAASRSRSYRPDNQWLSHTAPTIILHLIQ